MHQCILSYMLLLQTETAQVDRKKQLDEMSDEDLSQHSKLPGQKTRARVWLSMVPESVRAQK